jgi:hypothetical protein
MIVTHGNPYTHYEETRRSIPARGRACAWCGNRPRTLYAYGATTRDVCRATRYFCNRTCAQDYGR